MEGKRTEGIVSKMAELDALERQFLDRIKAATERVSEIVMEAFEVDEALAVRLANHAVINVTTISTFVSDGAFDDQVPDSLRHKT